MLHDDGNGNVNKGDLSNDGFDDKVMREQRRQMRTRKLF